MVRCVLIGFFCLGSISAWCQGLIIKKTAGAVQLDALMTEPEWQQAGEAKDFMQFFPSDTSLANAQTSVRIMYDQGFIYVFATLYSLGARKYVTPSLRRDFRGEANDSFTVVFDTFSDRSNAYFFGVNPFGVQREGLIANGGATGRADDFGISWDNKWYCTALMNDSSWTVEMAIPFKTLRFKEGIDAWNVNFYRIDTQFAERSTWSPIPRNQALINLTFSKQMRWDEPLAKPGSNISLIPYVASGINKNFISKEEPEKKLSGGMDAKLGIGPAMNLDLTINPDFSQVEVDQQVINLDRFEIFFPERRQFFQENADLFANFGVDGNRPFFSRRIGLQDTSKRKLNQNIAVPIYGGARLSGKINNKLRLGLLTMQANEVRAARLPSTNFTVAALQQRFWSRSNIGLIMVNKQAWQDSIGGAFTLAPQQYNRVVGVDLNLGSKNNVWNGKYFFSQSFSSGTPAQGFTMGGFVTYSIARWVVDVSGQRIGSSYSPESGFLRRRDITQITPTLWYNRYPSGGVIQSHGPGFSGDALWNEKYGMMDWSTYAAYRINFRNTGILTLQAGRSHIYLLNSFDPSGTGGTPLEAHTDYLNYVVNGRYFSDARKKLSIDISTSSGQYYNGSRLNFSGSVTYRYQPWGFTSINFSYNGIRLPEPYNNASLIVIGPRFDFTFTRNLFWTTYLQYNNQVSNFNINSRLQWRFKPVSDIFLVYTDNYFTDAGASSSLSLPDVGRPKSRALVLKFTYWFNL
jgi:Domain of unknown function (DUF5916)